MSRARQYRLPELWARVHARRNTQNLKNTTLAVTEQAWTRIAASSLASTPVARIEAADVQTFINEWRESAGRKNLTLLRDLHAEARALGFDGSDWTAGLKVPTGPPRKRLFLDTQQVSQLAAALPRKQDSQTVQLLAYTGLRVGELAALRVCDWDSRAGRIHVLQSASFLNGHVEIHTVRTKKSERVVPVPAPLAPMLDDAANGQDPLDFLWRSAQGHVWRPQSFRKRSGSKTAAESIGVPDLRVHDLRHSYASIVRSSGADLATLSRVMGHSSIKVTIDLYGGIYDVELDHLAQGLNDMIGTKLGGVH